jgi:hypothetical protein
MVRPLQVAFSVYSLSMHMQFVMFCLVRCVPVLSVVVFAPRQKLLRPSHKHAG